MAINKVTFEPLEELLKNPFNFSTYFTSSRLEQPDAALSDCTVNYAPGAYKK
jgi:hypothetical protein